MSNSDDTRERRAQRCPNCKASLYLSHVEYGGRGSEVPVLRCSSCGNVVRGQPRARQAHVSDRSSRRSRAPIDEGPPPNPVIDPEVARRLLGGE